MKTLQTLLLTGLIAVTLGCGYKSKSTMPAVAGNVPAVTQLTPNNTLAGTVFTLEVDGTSFAGDATVSFNGTKLTPDATTRTATKLEVSIPASADMTAGTVQVTVTNPGTPGGIYGGGTLPETSTPMNFTIN